jgi:hypothetical protein
MRQDASVRWLWIVPVTTLIILAMTFAGLVLVLDLWQIRSRHAASSTGCRLRRPAQEQTGKTDKDFRRVRRADIWFGWFLLAGAAGIAIALVTRFVGWLVTVL